MSEIMAADKGAGGFDGRGEIEVRVKRAGKGLVQRMMGQMSGKKAKRVFVDFPRGAVARVKVSRDGTGLEDTDFRGETGIQKSRQPVRRYGKIRGKIGMGHLSPGRHAGIGPTRPGDPHPGFGKGFQSLFKKGLDSRISRLNLPSRKRAAVVGQKKSDPDAFHPSQGAAQGSLRQRASQASLR